MKKIILNLSIISLLFYCVLQFGCSSNSNQNNKVVDMEFSGNLVTVKVSEKNSITGEYEIKEYIHSFGALNDPEIDKKMALSEEQINSMLSMTKSVTKSGIPARYDARDYGLVTPARHQGWCGSCWAFALVGAMESHILKFYPAMYSDFSAETLDLSEQQLVSCELNQNGCCGGYLNALDYWKSHGPIREDCTLYNEISTICNLETMQVQRTVQCNAFNNCQEYPFHVVSSGYLQSLFSLSYPGAIFTYGPSPFRFDVYDDFITFMHEAGPNEIYTQRTGNLRTGHAVLMIGYDSNNDAFLCKNSWGATDGPNNDGTFWISRIGHAHNLNYGMYVFTINACDPRPCQANSCPEVQCCGTQCQ